MPEFLPPTPNSVRILNASGLYLPEHAQQYEPFGAKAVQANEGMVLAQMHKEKMLQMTGALATDVPELAESYYGLADIAETTEDIANQNQGKHMLKVREKLLGLNDKKHKLLDEYLKMYLPEVFNHMQVSAELEEAESAEDGSEEVSHEPDHVRWLATAPSGQLLNFLQWHNSRIETINNDPGVLEKLKEERIQFASKVQDAVAEGELPDVVLERLADIHSVPTAIGDVFDMVMEDRDGYHQPAKGNIVLKEGYEPRVHFHELTHALLGRLAGRLSNEAMTEHIAHSLSDSNFNVMDPFTHHEGAYESYRSLMSVVLRSGLSGDLMRQAIAAFCSKDAGSLENFQFEAALLESYGGIDIEEFIDQEIATVDAEVRSGKNVDELDPEDNAFRYAADIVKFLGSVLKGKTDEDILQPSMRRINSLGIPEDEKIVLRQRRSTEILPHVQRVRQYVNEHRAKSVA